MDFLAGFLSSAFWFVVVLTVLVFVHEMGHYLVARWCGVRVQVFSIGFGPEIFGWNDKHLTRWKISAVPVGGYVKMFGESPSDSDDDGVEQATPEDEAGSFSNKRISQRAAIVTAGPAANFLYAIVVMAVVFAIMGQPFSSAQIGWVEAGSAAEKAGMRAGDVITRIDDSAVQRFEDILWIVRMNPGRSVDILVDRGGVEHRLTAILQTTTDSVDSNQKIGRLGVSSSGGYRFVRHDPATAIWRASVETARITSLTLQTVWQIITGNRSAKELGGPLRIGQMSGKLCQTGAINCIMFSVILSINLGLLNLFPIPLLDGGHLLFYLAETVRGKPLGRRVQEYGAGIGLTLVVALMLFVTWNDLVQLRAVKYFVDLVT